MSKKKVKQSLNSFETNRKTRMKKLVEMNLAAPREKSSPIFIYK